MKKVANRTESPQTRFTTSTLAARREAAPESAPQIVRATMAGQDDRDGAALAPIGLTADILSGGSSEFRAIGTARCS